MFPVKIQRLIMQNQTSRLMTKRTKWHVRPAKTQISLGIRVFAIRMKICFPLSAQRRLWSDWADLSLWWEHMPFCWFCLEAAQTIFDGLLSTLLRYGMAALLNKSMQNLNWVASWQNQQNNGAPSEDSDQPGYPLSLVRVFAVRSVGS